LGFLQHIIATPILGNMDSNTDLEVNPLKIVFWYDGLKATPMTPDSGINPVNPKKLVNNKR
jgi:hypothetical protein